MAREEVTFTSGGERCAAWWYPAGDDGGASPCVVMAHGFTGTREDGLPAYAERFAAAGLAALVFDYRHFGDSEGSPRQLVDIHRQLEDWRAAVAFARALRGVDADRIALWGSSFSGGHVVRTAADDACVAAVVAQVPFADGLATVRAGGPAAAARLTAAGLRDLGRALTRRPPLLVPSVGPPGTLAAMSSADAEPGFRAIVPDGSRWRNEVAARVFLRVTSYRPLRAARRVRCPLLVCVGDRDVVTPPGPALRMAERAPRGEAVRYPIGHFDVYVGEWFERAVADQVAFLRRHLLAAAPPPDGSPAGGAGSELPSDGTRAYP